MKRFAAVTLVLAAALGFVEPPHGSPPPVLRADAAVVLSGDVDYLRLRRAALLYSKGAVARILLTGSGIGGDSAVAMKVQGVKMGLPDEAFLLEPASKTTRENLAFAEPIVRAQGWRHVALVTSASHMGRAQLVARRAMPDVDWIPIPVEDTGAWSGSCSQRLKEWAKIFGYLLLGWL